MAGWQVSQDVVWAGEETVRLLHVGTGEFRSLNHTGSAIWCLMADGADNEKIARRLARGNSGVLAQIAGDVASFLAQLAECGIVVAAR
jgi:Coenzyme PQQ synthesis protein D (PqqD)